MTGDHGIILYGDDIKKLEDIRQFIEGNLNAKLGVRHLAARFHISTATLKRHFKAHYQIPVALFVQDCRMKKAMQLLCQHAKPVNVVGIMVGYSDRSAFTHAFTRYYGFPPVHFLK